MICVGFFGIVTDRLQATVELHFNYRRVGLQNRAISNGLILLPDKQIRTCLSRSSMKRILSLLIAIVFTSAVFARPITVKPSDVITIPVVIHVLYNQAVQNISDAQILSQLAVLNKDFRGLNEDRINVPVYFSALVADAGFEFRLARTDAKGFATTGIIRKQTSIQMFSTDDRIKSSSRGGDDAWDRNRYLNIWIGNLAGGILGYTSSFGGPAEKDGVVIQYTAFGTTGTVSAPFNMGRTATHEIGHWLNLIHIWGDTYCGDDQVDDTPKQRSSNRGVPTGEKFSCEANGHGDMYMNFMDLTNDAAMCMFTKGQRERMRNAFAAGGTRSTILASNALSVSTLTAPVETTGAVKDALSLSVYPVPSNSRLTITLSGSQQTEASQLTVYNYLGYALFSKTMSGKAAVLDISNLANGVYILRSSEGQAVKFVKN